MDSAKEVAGAGRHLQQARGAGVRAGETCTAIPGSSPLWSQAGFPGGPWPGAPASPGLRRGPPAPWGRRPAADPRRGGGVGRRAGRGGPAGAQVSSFIHTRTGRPRGQRPSSQRRQTRRCHCRCHLRVTTASPVRPGPPKSTPLSISGAPRRSSSLRGLTVGCSFHTRPWRPSERTGKPLGERAYPRLTSPDLFHSGYPDPRVLSALGLDRPLSEEGKGPRSVSRGRNVTGSKEGTVVVAVNERVPRCFWLRPSTSERNLRPAM